MATLTQTFGARYQTVTSEVTGWAQENLLRSPYALLFNLVLAGAAVAAFRSQFQAAPLVAGIIGGLWLLGLIWVVVGALLHRLDPVGGWLKERLYASSASALVTLLILLLLTGVVRPILDWAVFNASFSPTPVPVAERSQAGAIWGVILANLKLFMVGQFPSAQVWRVWTTVGLLLALTVISLPVYGPYRLQLKAVRRWVTLAWLLTPPIFWILLRGISESGPLRLINTNTWGGLLLTLIISVFAIVVSFPMGILLALGRRSQIRGVPAWLTFGAAGAVAAWGLATYTLPNLPLSRTFFEYVLILWPVWLLGAAFAFQRTYQGNVVAAFSTVYIEFVRGVPLITVLFMAQFLLPLFLPVGMTFENAFRAMWGFALFSAAYLAENVRGGLQSIPKGQYEAAEALGLSTFHQYWFIILPQALRVVIPPIVGQFIGLFKDTTLVAIVGLLDILNIANAVIAQPDWLGLRRETYVFVSVVFYVGCFLMAAISGWLERRLGVGQR
jgi:general L-amino acid transport system permease protein